MQEEQCIQQEKKSSWGDPENKKAKGKHTREDLQRAFQALAEVK